MAYRRVIETGFSVAFQDEAPLALALVLSRVSLAGWSLPVVSNRGFA